MKTKFIPITKEQDQNIKGLWCLMCVFGCQTENDCPPCLPHEREDGQRGYYVKATEIMASVPMSFLNKQLQNK